MRIGLVLASQAVASSVTGTYVDREARKDKAPSGRRQDSLLPDQFKRISKAGVPAFGIIGSTSLASIAIIFNYLGSAGTTVLATPVLMTVHLRGPRTASPHWRS